MTPGDLVIDKADHGSASLIESLAADTALGEGQVLVEVERFALTTNNMSYARAGEYLGYWNFYPGPTPEQGRLPVWGFARVAQSAHPELAVGEELFGCFTIARRIVMQPSDVTELCWNDATEHRVVVHPWYNRYYRVGSDPLSAAGHRDLQPVLWALFMTGWEIARDLQGSGGAGASTIVLSSASSKTAWSGAWTLSGSGLQVIGLTSPANVEFTEQLGCYDRVVTYDDFDPDHIHGTVAFVDIAGNSDLVAAVHQGFGERLVQSLRVGGTHRGAGSAAAEQPGPERRFFFIPDIAEAKAADLGQAEYHAGFAHAWADFAPWAQELLRIDHGEGPEAMLQAYLAMQSGSTDPSAAQLFSY